MSTSISLTINDYSMPDGFSGVLIETEKSTYNMFLSESLSDPERKAAFLHEMMHIYYREFLEDIPDINELENRIHNELPQLLDIVLHDDQE